MKGIMETISNGSGFVFAFIPILVFAKQTNQAATHSIMTSESTNQTGSACDSSRSSQPIWLGAERKRKKCGLNASLMFLNPPLPSCLRLNRHSGEKGKKCNQYSEQPALTFWAFSAWLKEKSSLSKRHSRLPEGRRAEVVF